MKPRLTDAEHELQQARLETLFDLEDEKVDPPIGQRVTAPPRRCGANLGRDHDFTMKGSDGQYRCWFCCRRKE